ncbi:MFS transporter [Actinoplanes sp. NPDC051411]|uniref:MFS transporter n=1 Tax=Actinoplanes sp. NPDC051411 TaxID=3155522 RepID=UPI00343BDD47
MSSDLLHRMDRSRFTGRHLTIYLALLVGHFLDGFVINMTGALVPGMAKTYHLGTEQIGHFSSSLFAGMLIGAAVAGTAADRLGRKFLLIASIVVFAGFSFAAVFADSFTALLWLRALQGLGLGAEIAVVLPYIAEFMPSRHRGPMVTMASAAWILGLPVAAGIGALVVPGHGFHTMFALGAIAVLAAGLVLVACPESVRFLLRSGRVEQARRVVDRIATPSASLHEELTDDEHEGGLGNVRFLLGRAYARYTVSIWLMELCAGAFLYGMSSWLPSILEKRGVAELRSLTYTAIITAAAVVGAVLAGQLINRIGRRLVMSVSFLAAAVFCLIWGATTATAAVITLGFIVQFFGAGLGGATLFAYASELYPTAGRATGLGWAAAWQKAGGLVMPTLVGYVLAAHAGNYVFFVLFAVISVIAGASAILATFETRDRSVEQITRDLRARVGHRTAVPGTEPIVN